MDSSEYPRGSISSSRSVCQDPIGLLRGRRAAGLPGFPCRQVLAVTGRSLQCLSPQHVLLTTNAELSPVSYSCTDYPAPCISNYVASLSGRPSDRRSFHARQLLASAVEAALQRFLVPCQYRDVQVSSIQPLLLCCRCLPGNAASTSIPTFRLALSGPPSSAFTSFRSSAPHLDVNPFLPLRSLRDFMHPFLPRDSASDIVLVPL